MHLTKHSVNKEVISVLMAVFLPFRMLIRVEKKSMIPHSGMEFITVWSSQACMVADDVLQNTECSQ